MVALNKEHRQLASLLDALSQQSDQLLPGRDPDHGLMRDIVRYMADFPDEHHHPREELLFERLVRRDAGSVEIVRGLEAGHAEIYRRSRELLDELERIVSRGTSADARRLKYLCDRYIGFYREHINTEEGRLFPRATEKLRQNDWAAINVGSASVDDPLFGARVRREYRRLSQYLAIRTEKIAEDIAVAELFGVEALVESLVVAGSAMGEIRGLVGRRLLVAIGECRTLAGEHSVISEPRGLVHLPLALARSLRTNADAGAREVAEVLARSRDALVEPVAIRLRYLRRLMG
jgi:hemerythrin-like domain-containing protein